MKKSIVFTCLVFAMLSCSKNSTTTTPPTPSDTLVIVHPPLVDTVAQYGTPFTNVPDKQDAIIYQVNIRAFSSQGFAGVTARLDSIKALGINVVYLMPIYPVGTLKAVNSPYCIKDYKAVNTEFGTLADLRALIDGAHARNMSVILDWVANHTSWDNAWVAAHKDWYLQDGAGNILSPPNTGYTDVAQLNFTNAAMRLEMIKDMKYWVYSANIDGFRCDYADGPPANFWGQAIDTLRNISSHKLLMLAESDASSLFSAGFDFTFGFNFYGQMKSVFSSNSLVQNIDNLNTSEYANASNGQQIVRYLTNHDVNGSDGTPLDLFGGKTGSIAAFVVVAYMKSVPMMYNGQEVGFPTKIIFPFTGTKITWNINPDITAEYKKILAFRNSSKAIRQGTLVSYSSADVCAFTKSITGEKVFVLSNLRNNTLTYTLPSALVSTSWTNVFTGVSVSLGTQVSLQPYSYLVLKQ
ncbi:alpha-amylase family glycosyl hydrolase [Parasediminibacterium sp. JCM 36343]|uniref:alpha-amylase family glycosyl hydrolase n=1 Tax=Parasediminibacterium sp. JCM 36343 TaxID=3374279 RepID=UPI00397BFA93